MPRPQQGSSPSIQYAPSPASAVNPFAQTAGPKNMPVLDTPGQPGDYGPPPSVPLEFASTTKGVGDPAKAPQVSPLAVSNVDSNRGAMVDAMVASAQAKRDIPGTQMMPSMATPPVAPSAKKQDRTQLLGAIPMPSGAVAPAAPRVANPPSAPRVATAPIAPVPPSVRPAAIPAPAAQSGNYSAAAPEAALHADASGPYASQVSHGSQPGVQLPRAPSYPDPSSSQPGVPLPQGMYPQHPTAQGWNAAPQLYPPAPAPYPAPPTPPAYGYGYPPGTHVNVTWSNGQRYPGTVQRIAGNQCLVVFPDGQHHWIDMQYVGPA